MELALVGRRFRSAFLAASCDKEGLEFGVLIWSRVWNLWRLHVQERKDEVQSLSVSMKSSLSSYTCCS